jgi:antitoxin component YwqK of YwqJK toxin-antitoxin module
MGPLSYELYSNGNVRDYAINNSCVESIYTFNANGQIQEIWFQPKFDDLLFIYNYSDEGILRLKREFDRWNVEVQYLWIYDSKGQIREEGFENKGVPFGIWKYYNRSGKLKRTVDFGPKK